MKTRWCSRRGVRLGAGLLASVLAAVPALHGGGDLQAAVPGDNGRLAFMSNRSGSLDIWTMARDGSDAVQLTTHESSDNEPSFSPDGRRIAFTSTRDGNAEIYVMDADGSGQTRLTFNPGFDQQPAFSPDGQRIAFSSTRNGFSDLYVMNADGSGLTRLTDDGWPAGQPEFSPDGQRLAFIRNVSGQVDIFVTANTTTCCSRGSQLTETLGPDLAPSFSPDGGTIAFVSNRDGNFEIYTMRRDGTNETRITTNDATDNLPSFSPDGRRIAFESNRSALNVDIYTMAPDGSDVARLTTHADADAWPDWGVSTRETTAPEPPTPTGTAPNSPADHNAPLVTGDAEPGSTVRLYADRSCAGTPAAIGPAADFASPGLAISVVDDSSTTITATAADADGNVSGCSASSITYVEDSTPPETSIDSGPSGVTDDPTPTFAFSSTEAGSDFECAIDRAALEPCRSPHTTAALADGPHTFDVRAADAAGHTDATPASRSFTVCTSPGSALALILDGGLRPLDPALAETVAGQLCR